MIKVAKGIELNQIPELELLHSKLFDCSLQESKYDFEKVMNLDDCFVIFNEHEIISFVGVSIKQIVHNGKILFVALIGCVMTNPKFQHQGYAKKLIKLASNYYTKKYDSVIIQAHNWDIYKSFDLIPTTIKYEYEIINHTNQINKAVNSPDVMQIWKIDNYTKNGASIRTIEQIKNQIDISIASGLKFIANNGAYVWYNNHKIDEFNYIDISSLISLLSRINLRSNLLLVENIKLKSKKMQLINKNKRIIVTKTFGQSKHFIENINISDFIM